MEPLDILRKQQRDITSILTKQDKGLKKIIKKQNKDLKKALNVKITGFIKQEGRVRIQAKRRHELEELYNYKCNTCKKASGQLGVKLQIHHKNMKNNDNRLSNLELLCPTHHYAKHGKGKNPKIKNKSNFLN